ncbi:MAG: hypothetical protein ABSG43_04875 [Solirubrobacteraceae bacterium]|jgi:hypothetical protein
MTQARAPAVALAAALLTALAGCGNTDVLGQARTLYVALSEYRVAPQSAQADPGQLTILVHNYGRLTHDLVVSRSGRTDASTRPIPPGQSAELTLTLTRGSYLLASSIQSDQTLGAYGTLRVGR